MKISCRKQICRKTRAELQTRHYSALEALPAATQFNLAGAVTIKTKDRSRGHRGLFQSRTKHQKKTRSGGRSMLWTKHMTGTQNSQFCTDLSHHYPSVSWHWVSARNWKVRGIHLVPAPEQSKTTLPHQNFILQWECKDKHFPNAVVLNLNAENQIIQKNIYLNGWVSPWLALII